MAHHSVGIHFTYVVCIGLLAVDPLIPECGYCLMYYVLGSVEDGIGRLQSEFYLCPMFEYEIRQSYYLCPMFLDFEYVRGELHMSVERRWILYYPL